jgi:metal-responsive CopG/Arc/MetJ family transcriptional regulator
MKRNSDEDSEMIPFGMKMPQALIDRIDRHVERFKRANAGLSVTRSSVIRMLLHSALETAEGKHP